MAFLATVDELKAPLRPCTAGIGIVEAVGGRFSACAIA
jgi:hypothetical protein